MITYEYRQSRFAVDANCRLDDESMIGACSVYTSVRKINLFYSGPTSLECKYIEHAHEVIITVILSAQATAILIPISDIGKKTNKQTKNGVNS